MFFKQFFEPVCSSYTYLLASDVSKRAIIIDAVREHLDKYLALLAEHQLTLAIAIDTHVHADHVTALGLLQDKTGCEILMGDASQVAGLTRTFKDGDILEIDEVKLTVMHTPGHTDDSYCFVMSDRVFTGDTLLINGTGRTDFQHGDSQQAYDSLFNKLLQLPDEHLVFPGHDYNQKSVSTIGHEKTHNPRLQVDSAEAYAEIMDNLNLPKPLQIDEAVPANLRCGRVG